MRVLLIEDDESFRTTLAMALKRRGCEVWQGANPGEALRLAGEVSPEGIVLDLRLSSRSGMPLIPDLRERLPNARIVILTGYGNIPNALEAAKLGADDYLLKPASADQVLQALHGKDSSVGLGEVPSLARLEWEHIQRVLHDLDGNVSRTAEALGIDRRTLQRKLAKLPPEA